MARYTIDTEQRTVTEEEKTGSGWGCALIAGVIIIIWKAMTNIVDWFQGLWHQAVEFTTWLVHATIIVGVEGSFILACILAIITVLIRVLPDRAPTSWRRWAFGTAGFALVPIVLLCYARWLDHLERTPIVGSFTVGHAALSSIGIALAITLASLRWDKT